jgi:pimeloyl-ACP methyl ester carboxylesterase
MPTTVIDDIVTRYEVIGSGEPLLMFAPGGFDATIEKWTTLGVYAKTRMIDHLSARFQCIVFDRRECGHSGGRVEAVTWSRFVAQAKGLLDELGVERAHLLGGCMGCSSAFAFAVAHPDRTRRMVLFWPVGGARYRMTSHQRFADHLAFVKEQGLPAVVDVARQERKAFGADPRGGPWASVILHDELFAKTYAGLDVDHYVMIVTQMMRNLFDRDTAPGAEPEQLVRLETPTFVVPGHDASHATSAARYLEECIPGSEYWDIAVDAQTEAVVGPRIVDFLQGA